MSDLNRVVLVGRLTRDPELKSTVNGKFFCRFSLASNRVYFQRDSNEKKEEVGYYDCIAYGKQAETIAKYLGKGRRIGVDGSLRYSTWDGPDGQKRSKVEIQVENFMFLDNKGESGGGMSRSEPTPAADYPDDMSYGGPLTDEDIPF